MGLRVLAFECDGESEGDGQSLTNPSNVSSGKASNGSIVAG